MDQMDIIFMQDLDHLESIYKHLNLIPLKNHECNFSRVKDIFLNEVGGKHRQDIFFTRFLTPELNPLVNRVDNRDLNRMQRLKTKTMIKIDLNIQQIFQRFECGSVSDAIDTRFNNFI